MAVWMKDTCQSRFVEVNIVFGNIRMRKKEASSIRSATAQSGVSPRASTAESGIPAPQMNATKTSAMSAISTDR